MEKNLSEVHGRVKRNLLIDYGRFGYHLPDVDLILYDEKTMKVVGLIRGDVEGKDRADGILEVEVELSARHIKVFFITLDEDGTLTRREPIKKGRDFDQTDLDESYVLTEEEIEER